VFFSGLRRHFAEHRFGNADLGELLASWTAAGAVDLAAWTQPWLGSSGLDTLTARAEGGRVVVDKTTDPTAARSHRIRVVGLDERGSQLFDQNITVRDARTEIGLPAGEARLLVADGFDETWAKARFSNWDDVEAVLPGIADPNTRIVVYNAVRDAVRDGELDPARALTLLLTALSTEPEPMTFAALLGFAGRELAGPFCPPEQRPWRRNLVAGLAASVLASSPAGSDHQLEAARALIRFDDTERWASWLEDAGVPDGLLVDVELRWLMLGALAELSGVDEATLAGELARDPSAAGQRQAAYIRAARPDEVSKARAWALVTEPSTASAYELYATAEGLFRPLQATPTRRYALAYFDAMASTAAHRRGWVLSKVISAGFPVLLSEPEVLAAAQATLARDDLAVPVRRALMDGTDELRRAVASITRFG
jgi:aminopeptidase N